MHDKLPRGHPDPWVISACFLHVPATSRRWGEPKSKQSPIGFYVLDVPIYIYIYTQVIYVTIRGIIRGISHYISIYIIGMFQMSSTSSVGCVLSFGGALDRSTITVGTIRTLGIIKGAHDEQHQQLSERDESHPCTCLKGRLRQHAGSESKPVIKRNSQTTLLRVIPALTHCSDIVSDISSGSIYIYIYIYFLTFYLTFFLAYTLTFYLSFFWHSI